MASMAQKIQVDGKDAPVTVEFEESRRNVVNVVVMGESGVGKLALVKELIGKDAIRRTKRVEVYPVRRGDVEVEVFDTPGLFDPRVKNSDIFREIADKTKRKVDLVVYCHDMRKRVKNSDVSAISDLSKTLHQSSATDGSLWECVLYVLTFANKVEEDIREEERDGPSCQGDQLEKLAPSVNLKFVKLLQEYGEALHELAQKVILEEKKLPNAVEVAKTIPVVPAGYRKSTLPDCVDWLTVFWKEALSRVNAHRNHNDEIQKCLYTSKRAAAGGCLGIALAEHRNHNDEMQKCLCTSKRAAAGGCLGITLAVCMAGLITIARVGIGSWFMYILGVDAIAIFTTKIAKTGIGATVIATLSTKLAAIIGGTVSGLSGAIGVSALTYAGFKRWRAHCLKKKQ